MNNMQRYASELSSIVKYIGENYEVYLKDTCFGVQMKEVFDRVSILN